MQVIYSQRGSGAIRNPAQMMLGSIQSRQRRQALAAILQLNRDGLLLSGPNGRGFVDARSPSRRLLPGITPHISAAPRGRIKRVFKAHNVNTRTIRFFRFGHHEARPLSSNLHAGRVVHRALMHSFTCQANAPPTDSPYFPLQRPLDGAVCRCQEVHGPIRITAAERPLLDQYVQAARDFMTAERLKPVLSEQVIVDDRLGTRFDALMARHNSRTNVEEIVIVSWKTGGASLYLSASTKSEQELRDKRRDHYVAQVLYEAALLSSVYQVRIDGAYIVNLLATANGPAGFYMSLSSDAMTAAVPVYTELRRLQNGG